MKFKCWIFILALLIFCYISGCISQICLNTNSVKTWLCCNNHEEINGTCVECMNGYFSDFGEPCKKCQKGFYGRKCIGVCKCKASESCHHIEGCIKGAETTRIVEKESTSAQAETHAVTYGTSLSLTLFTNKHSSSEMKNENNGLSQVTFAEGNSFIGLSLKTDIGGILTYSICTGGLTCIVLFLLCIYRYRYTLTKCNRKQCVVLDSNILQANAQLSTDYPPIGHFEEVYEMIDESKMLDYPVEMARL